MQPTSQPTPQPTDLIERARNSDPQALAAIYERYAPQIYRYIYYRVNDAEQARDLQSDVFLRMIEGIGRYEDRGWSISSWLYRIARDRTIDVLRRQGRWGARQPLEEWSEAVDGPEEGVVGTIERAALTRAMAHLSEPQRQVVRLRFIYDLSLQETANQLGRSVGSVKALQHRAVENLRALMQAELGEED